MKISGKRVLVTGGAGFIGSYLVDELVKENKVIVIDDFSIGSEKNLAGAKKSRNLKIVRGDMRNIADVKKSMSGVEIVFHLAAMGVRESLNNPVLVHDINAGGTLNLLFEARKNKVQKFVHISSSEVYGTAQKVPMDEKHPLSPQTVYGASKLAGEQYTLAYFRTHGFPSVVVRPFNTYGPRSHFVGTYGEVIPRFVIRAMNNLSPIVFGDGKQTRDFTYVNDTVDGILKACQNDKLIGGIVNIAYGQERSINDVANIVLKYLKKEYLKISYQQARPGDVERHFADNKKAKKLLKFAPKTGLEEGIAKYIDWLVSEKVDIKKALEKINERNW